MRETETRKILQDEQCFEIIRKKLRRDAMDDFSLMDYEIVPIDEVNGFMDQYYILKATVARSPLEIKNINFFTKTLPPISSPQYDFSQEYGTFKKEVALYTTVFPELLDGRNERCIPECFLGVENNVIVLEDMAHSGYTMTDKFTPFNYEHCVILMKTLAKFHAKSLIFERQYKKTLHDEFAHCMQEGALWPRTDGRARAMFDAAVKGIVSMIDLIPGPVNGDQCDGFKSKIAELCADHTDKLSPSAKHKNVLCHGDLYNSPAHDVLCFLQFTTTRQLRKKHSDSLFRIYHDSMAAVMKEAGLSISDVFTWDEFDESIRDLRVMCMTHGVLNTPIMLLRPDAVSKYFCEEPRLLESILYVDRTPLICNQFEEAPEYRARMIDGLLELHDYLID